MIYVFRTNVTKKSTVDILRRDLDRMIAATGWNFDLEDCDHILRADTSADKVKSIIALLTGKGFECEELSD